MHIPIACVCVVCVCVCMCVWRMCICVCDSVRAMFAKCSRTLSIDLYILTIFSTSLSLCVDATIHIYPYEVCPMRGRVFFICSFRHRHPDAGTYHTCAHTRIPIINDDIFNIIKAYMIREKM